VGNFDEFFDNDIKMATISAQDFSFIWTDRIGLFFTVTSVTVVYLGEIARENVSLLSKYLFGKAF
tara:strand:- start:1198 stop:1392 length:195 start_codon:yes stop_codon:yes gene_type:complete